MTAYNHTGGDREGWAALVAAEGVDGAVARITDLLNRRAGAYATDRMDDDTFYAKWQAWATTLEKNPPNP